MPIRDELDIEATNISDVTVNARRARVTCNAEQNITTDGPLTVHMVDCPAVPTLSISNLNQNEGNGGTANMSFTVNLSGNTDNLPVSAQYQTADGTASSGSDYDAVSGTITFAPGETSKTIDVPVHGDTTIENDETFSLQLSDVQFATPTTLSSTGTILDDDAPVSYPHPAAASPVRVSLVPVFTQCGGPGNPPNGGHAAPLATGSCIPSVPTSNTARVGAQSSGSVELATVPGDGNPTNGDQADIAITVALDDVGTTGGQDYDPNPSGADLTEVARFRITDTRNCGPSPCSSSYENAGTTADLDFAAPVDCAASAGPEGASCSANTSADALLPGAAVESERTIVQVFRIRVYDSGQNGARQDGGGDDELFVQQGIYVP
jgi:Calx-beta domain